MRVFGRPEADRIVEQALVIHLATEHGMAHEAVADRLGITIGQVRTILIRAGVIERGEP